MSYGKGHIKRDPRGFTKYEYQMGKKLGKLTPRMKLLGDLASIGLRDKEILNQLKKKPTAKYTGHINIAKKDDMVLARTNSNVEDMIAEARGIIQRASVKAATNYEEAVDQGDLKASGKVLDLCGAFAKQSDVNLNLNFGSWLKTAQNRDDVINVTPKVELPQKREYIVEGQEIDEMPEGCSRLGDSEYSEDGIILSENTFDDIHSENNNET